MHPMLNIAVRAARAAGNIILRYVDRLDTLNVREKSRHDFVSEVDTLAEQAIIQTLRRAYPGHAILAEESGAQGGGDYQWIIDPLDGTTNFLHGFPQFAVSIGLRHRGVLEQAVVFDPLRNELFVASRGGGAHLDARRMRVSKVKQMDEALLGTGFPFRGDMQLETYLETFRTLLPRCAGIRRAGSAALDLAYVAAGRLDGFWELGLSVWDIAAGALLIQEAGGMVSDLAGGDEFLATGNVVAGNPRIHPALVEALRPYMAASLRE
jgi:myo-inositol-1(or 4)-monophosphatase